MQAAFLHKTLLIWVGILAVGFLHEKVKLIHIAAVGLLVWGQFVLVGRLGRVLVRTRRGDDLRRNIVVVCRDHRCEATAVIPEFQHCCCGAYGRRGSAACDVGAGSAVASEQWVPLD